MTATRTPDRLTLQTAIAMELHTAYGVLELEMFSGPAHFYSVFLEARAQDTAAEAVESYTQRHDSKPLNFCISRNYLAFPCSGEGRCAK